MGTNSNNRGSEKSGKDNNEFDAKFGSDKGEGAKSVDIRKTKLRWLFLVLACSFLMGSYFCYDNPGPLKTQLEKTYGWGPSKQALLYTVYSIPNMILPFFGGLFLDKIGMRAGLLLFTIVLTLGQFIFYLGG